MAYDPRKWYNLYDDTEQQENINSSKSTVNEDYIPYYSSDRSAKLSGQQQESSVQLNYLSSETEFSVDNSDPNTQYDPCSPAIDIYSLGNNKKEKDPRKLENYISLLQKFIRPLSPDYKRRLPYDIICQLANSLLDGTVFEIAKGLKDIQEITEKNLSQSRLDLVSEHRTKKRDMKSKHLSDLANCQNRTHQINILEKRHDEEKKKLNEQCIKEILQMDQKIVLEIDQKVSNQQLTLERAGLPLFFITNNPDDVKLQMFVLEFVMRLAKV